MGVNGKFWTVESNDPCLMIYVKFFVSVAHLLHPPRLHEWSVWFLLQWYERNEKSIWGKFCAMFCSLSHSFPIFSFLYLPVSSSFLSSLIFLSYLFHCPNFYLINKFYVNPWQDTSSHKACLCFSALNIYNQFHSHLTSHANGI